MCSVRSLLLDTLNELLDIQLKTFKFFLKDDVLEVSPCIQSCYLQSEVRTVIVDKIISHYGSERALDVCLYVLRKMQENNLAQMLEKERKKISSAEMTCDVRQLDQKKRIQEELKKKFEDMSEGTDKQGNLDLLNYIHTELYLVDDGDETGIAPGKHVSEETVLKPRDIFMQGSVRTVLTKGISGIGKTTLVQKFSLDWANGIANREIDFIYILPFRVLNFMEGKVFSLMQLLHRCIPATKGIKSISCEEFKILFILDGLDECQIHLDFQGNELSDVTEYATVDELLTNLIKGTLLPSALLWITSRPAAENQVPREYIHCVTEIRGFDEQQREEYFKKRFSEQSLAKRIIKQVKSSRSLNVMCHMPIFCRISATVLEHMKGQANFREIPKSLTEMYTHFLLIQTKTSAQFNNINSPKEVSEIDKDVFLKLAELAFRQLETNHQTFCEEDLHMCDVRSHSVFGRLCTKIFQEESEFGQRKLYSFVHVSIQEYLAALYVSLSFQNLKNNLKNDLQWYGLKWMSLSLSDLHTSAVDKALQSKNGHLDLFLRFLLSLRPVSFQNLLQNQQTHQGDNSQSCNETVKYVQEKIKENPSPETSINLFHCLNECNNSSFVREIQRFLNSGLTREKLTSLQWSALVHMLQMSEEVQDTFELKKYARSDEAVLKLLPVIKSSQSALLDQCSLTMACCEMLASAVSSKSSSLKVLDLSDNDLKDLGVQLLSQGLQNPDCKLEVLRLKRCNLTDASCEAIALALQLASSSITELDLSFNGFSDVKLLSNALMSPDCKLVRLDLNCNNLGDSGMGVICTALMSPCCKLERLDLSFNNITTTRMKPPPDVLKSPPKQRKLDACQDNANSFALKTLSVALTSPNCKLRRLDLRGNKLGGTEEMRLLCLGLTSPVCKLQMLDLSHNVLRDAGVGAVAGALAGSRCGVQRLGLRGNGVAREGAASLAKALRSPNCKLQQLDLAGNSLEDSGVKQLCQGLLSPDCELQILGLAECDLTEGCCTELASLLHSQHSQIRELDLQGNDLQNSGVAQLSVGLGDPSCKLERLGLSGCQVTEDGCTALATALRSNPSHLKYLDLSYNHPGDSGSTLLSAGLLDPNCVVLSHGGECRNRPGVQKYACYLSLDQNTTYRYLTLSLGNRKVTRGEYENPYPAHPDRFDIWAQVLCREGLTGRSYWEVEWAGRGIEIGVAYAEIARTGTGHECALGRNSKSWSLYCSGGYFVAWHNGIEFEVPFPSTRSRRIGVYLDWPAGTLSFYSISVNNMVLLYQFYDTFTHPLYPGFWLISDSSFILLE